MEVVGGGGGGGMILGRELGGTIQKYNTEFCLFVYNRFAGSAALWLKGSIRRGCVFGVSKGNDKG